MERELTLDDKTGKLKTWKKKIISSLRLEQLPRDGTSLQVEYEMLEQLNSSLLADTDCHDTFVQLKI